MTNARRKPLGKKVIKKIAPEEKRLLGVEEGRAGCSGRMTKSTI